MKRRLFILLCFPMIMLGQNVSIPDANFKAYLVGNAAINTNGDAEIQVSEAVVFNGAIDCNNLNISDLTGIEYFVALTTLRCFGNQLTSLDVSQNTALNYLHCGTNQLTSLNVVNNTALTSFFCYYNQLTSLDVRNGNNINTLFSATNNPNLSCISVDNMAWSTANWSLYIDSWTSFSNDCNVIPGCTDSIAINYDTTATVDDGSCIYAMTYVPDDNFEAYLEANGMGNGILNDSSVYTHHINTVTTLDVGNQSISDLTGIEDFAALVNLDCDSNQLINLDVTNNTALITLTCRNNQLTSLDVSGATALTYLYCYSNQLTSLDVSQNTALTNLSCYSNPLTSLDVSQNTALTYLVCRGNQLTSLDLSTNTALTYLWCSYNLLTSLDISNNTALTWLRCEYNQIITLDVSNNTDLGLFYCFNNPLISLDVSNNTSLYWLYCYANNLTSLDVSNNTALTQLWCDNNLLTSLDVSNNTSLNWLHCENNLLTSLDVSNNTTLSLLHCSDNPQLYCINVDDVAWADTNWTVANGNIDSTISFSPNCATAFGCLDPLACNYDSIATIYDSSCVYPVIWQQAFSICNGDSVIVGSSVYDTTGNYIDILTAGNGCDSIVYTNISLPLILQQALVLCVGDSIVVGGNVYNTAGNYIDTLNTVNGCDSIVYTNISIPAGMVITTNASSNNGYNISCFGGNDGWITIDVTGGSPPYTYDWNIGLTGDSIYDLHADSYSVIITDVNNCIAQSTVMLTDPNPFFANTSIANISCYGYCDGSAVTTPIGGIAPYLINWSNGTITPYVSGLCPGLYSVTITDFDNCIANDTILITEALPLISYDTLSVTATIVWNGLILFASGDYSANLITPSGCDSIANLNLTITNTTGILNITNTKRVLFKKTNVLGQETPYRRNTPLFYIYDDGTVEKQIIIE